MATTSEEWTRYALMGSKTATTPTNDEIASFKELVYAEITRNYPCILASVVSPATAYDIPAFAMWVGYATAAQMRDGGWQPPTAGALAGSGLVKVQVKSGDVTEQYGMLSEKSQEEQMAGWQAVIQRAKAAIPCVAAISHVRRTDISTGAGLGGYRRAENARRNC